LISAHLLNKGHDAGFTQGGLAVAKIKRVTFIAHDVRLIGRSPTNYARWNVDETISLSQFAKGFADWAFNAAHNRAPDEDSFDVVLKFWAHGRPGQLQFCREWITLQTVEQLRPLRPFVYLIEIYGCKVGGGSDGNMLCSRMASICDAYVRAASATQQYAYRGKDDALDFGRWEGIVNTWAPGGAIVQTESNPEAGRY
jgi:hypothetical protein